MSNDCQCYKCKKWLHEKFIAHYYVGYDGLRHICYDCHLGTMKRVE